jgi:hypothetical protein
MKSSKYACARAKHVPDFSKLALAETPHIPGIGRNWREYRIRN